MGFSFSQKKYYFIPRFSIILLLIFSFTLGLVSHCIIYFHQLNTGFRILHSLFMGILYDLMIACLFVFCSLIFIFIIRDKFEKFIVILLFFFYTLFQFIDINYYFVFGTHLPFQTIEYFNQLDKFSSNILDIIGNYTFILFFVAPNIIFVSLMWRYPLVKSKVSNINLCISLFLIIFLGSAAGVYPNSYVAKNMNDPLTSSALNYFYWSRKIADDQKIIAPIAALKKIVDMLPGEIPNDSLYRDLPLARGQTSNSCENIKSKVPWIEEMCSPEKMNILIILLESFRASEIDSYGSELGLTPNFKKWKNKGIFFKNFYANGFQTRHGEVATYCSVMPNYGQTVFSHYHQNHFLCLPELLRQSGYSTSWIHNADAAFDNQLLMLPKMGFEKIMDRFDFDFDTETLGWGYSDEALFNKWIKFLDQEKAPFFSSALTITNHHPFDVPESYQYFKNRSVQNKYYEAISYVDSMLNQFLIKASKSKWFKNTLIFVTADTSNYQNPQRPYKNFEEFVKTRSQIPLLILGGGINHSFEEQRFFSQIDLAPTIMDLLGVPYLSPWMGRSMLNANNDAIAYTNRPGNYWAVMSQKGRYYNESNQNDHYFGFQENDDLKLEYKLSGRAWIDTTKWLLQENKIWHE